MYLRYFLIRERNIRTLYKQINNGLQLQTLDDVIFLNLFS